jgi:hypothetical protein
VIGGLATGFTTSLSQRSQARAGMVAHDLAGREDLVREFMIAVSKTYGNAIGNNEPKMPEIVDLYAMVNRMHVLGMRKNNRARMLSCAQSSTPVSGPRLVKSGPAASSISPPAAAE